MEEKCSYDNNMKTIKLYNFIFKSVKLIADMGENAENTLTNALEKYINKTVGCSSDK